MRSSALLGLVAWQVMLADCVPMMQQPYDEIPHSLSNIELLIPLVMSDAYDASDASYESDASYKSDPRAAGERYERAHLDEDMPFSDIPSSAFVLDHSLSSSSHKHKRRHKHSRKQDLTALPRSAYLENEESDESGEPDERSELGELARHMWRACSRLVRAQASSTSSTSSSTSSRHQHELLLALCSELLDEAPVPARLPDCPYCAQAARRDFMPMGDNSYWVMNYMKSPRRRKRWHRPDLDQE